MEDDDIPPSISGSGVEGFDSRRHDGTNNFVTKERFDAMESRQDSRQADLITQLEAIQKQLLEVNSGGQVAQI